MMNKKKAILVDVDGTLLNNKHREGFLRRHPKQWKDYNYNMKFDTPYDDIVWLVKTLHKAGCTILICTARQDQADIIETTRWQLDEVCGLEGVYEKIYHRAAEDYRDDTVVKIDLLEQIKLDGYEPYMVLDDRNKVVKAWRDAGLRCLQVQDGDF